MLINRSQEQFGRGTTHWNSVPAYSASAVPVNTHGSLMAILVVAVGFASGCTRIPRSPDQFPATEIVFQTAVHPLMEEEVSIGFVNADGSEEEYLSITAPGVVGMEASPAYPLITSDNLLLIMRGMPDTGAPGRLAAYLPGRLAEVCSDDRSAVIGPVTLTHDEEHVVAGILEPPSRIAVFDLEACLAGGFEPGEGVHTVLDIPDQYVPCFGAGAALSAGSERLAFSDCASEEPTITVLTLATGEGTSLGPGIAPSWSPDDSSIAYRGPGGISVADANGGNVRVVVEYIVPREPGRYEALPAYPSWSPDGDWLVYHKCLSITGSRDDCRKTQEFAIFKVNLETGQEVKIVDGGLNPYWRRR